ncbi:hypothetical protein Lal_00041920 [Lupinus albus]|nr:hypothetical protein Lal_00041920 [Lupinus albus]
MLLLSQHFQSLWKSKAPLKVRSFVWRLFQDRIPYKDALIHRGVCLTSNDGTLCSFCNDDMEPTEHLFSSCHLTVLNAPIIIEVTCSPSPWGRIKINSDGAAHGAPGQSGRGAIFRDHKSGCLGCLAAYFEIQDALFA